MEIPHADLSEVTGVVFVEVGPVVVLATSHTATTGVLAVLPNATITGGNVAAARKLKHILSVSHSPLLCNGLP